MILYKLKSGMCSGSSLAPALAECYLNAFVISDTKFVPSCSEGSVLITSRDGHYLKYKYLICVFQIL